MKRSRKRLELAKEVVRQIRTTDLRQAHGGLLATSEAFDGYPCPGEYSWTCRP